MKENKKTDWSLYYSNPFFLSRVTRFFIASRIVKTISNFISPKDLIEIFELGGANSCCFHQIDNQFNVGNYFIIDNNSFGIDLSRKRFREKKNVKVVGLNILKNKLGNQISDITISCGLIEHFNQIDRKTIINKHVNLTKPDGLIVITFPTPTVLYRTLRAIAEFFGMWIFHDETPLSFGKVIADLNDSGRVVILDKILIWEIGFTQGMILARKI